MASCETCYFCHHMKSTGGKVCENKNSPCYNEEVTEGNKCSEWVLSHYYHNETNEDGESEIVSVNLTKSTCKNLAEYIEFNFIDYLRQCDDIDNILYVADMCEACKTLTEAAKGDHDDTRTSN